MMDENNNCCVRKGSSKATDMSTTSSRMSQGSHQREVFHLSGSRARARSRIPLPVREKTKENLRPSRRKVVTPKLEVEKCDDNDGQVANGPVENVMPREMEERMSEDLGTPPKQKVSNCAANFDYSPSTSKLDRSEGEIPKSLETASVDKTEQWIFPSPVKDSNGNWQTPSVPQKEFGPLPAKSPNKEIVALNPMRSSSTVVPTSDGESCDDSSKGAGALEKVPDKNESALERCKPIPLGFRQEERERANQWHVVPAPVPKRNGYENRYRTSQSRQQQISPRREPVHETRIASFTPFQNASSSRALVPVRNNKALASRNHGTGSYEHNFLKRKAMICENRACARPNMVRSSGYGNTARFHTQAQQQAVFTKIITETNYEYEEEESNLDHRAAGRVFVGKEKPKSRNRVRISDHPTVFSGEGGSEEHRNGQGGSEQQPNKRSRIPSIVLPGHGNSPLELPDPRSDPSGSVIGEDVELARNKVCECRKCKVNKKLLAESQSTIRYLTHMLVKKDEELQDFRNNNEAANAERTATHNHPSLNAEESGTRTSREHTPRAAPCPIPLSIDLDEFIRKYFRNLLYTKDFQDSPFSSQQFLHVAISARDCMAEIVLHKLNNSEVILNQRYDILMSKKSASTEPLDASMYFELIDSYKNFVRFIHHYFRTSVKQIETFEQSYLSLSGERSAEFEEPKSRRLYSKGMVVTINGRRYKATVIPIEEVFDEDEDVGGAN